MNTEYYNIAKRIQEIAIIPVIAIDNAKDAEPLAEALSSSGLLAAEVTFRTAAAKEAISIISKKYPNLLTGAGTVLTTKQVDEAVEAGAKFMVSPGFNPTVVDYCIEKSIPIYPGVTSPTGIEMALERGLSVLKFFPAEAAGGAKMVNSMSAPYGDQVTFMCTGGININNVTSYLDTKYVSACGGSWMVKPDFINNGEFEKIEKLCSEAVQLVKEWRK